VWLLRSVIMLVGVIAFLWIGMNNADQRVHFAFFTKIYDNLSLNLLLLIVFAAGMVFSFLISILNEFQLRSTIGRQRRECAQLESEISALRNLPLEESEDGGQKKEWPE
jgi:uncharacterized membrane protein YciS (DUF1049 family)